MKRLVTLLAVVTAFLLTCNQSIAQDLVVVQQTIVDDTINNGENLQLSCYVKNIHSTMANSGYVNYYIIEDTTDYNVPFGKYIDNDYYGSLNQNDSSNETSAYTINNFTPGKYWVAFVADRNESTTETNENNNIVFVPFWVLPNMVDFVIVHPTYAKDTLSSGESLVGNLYLKNVGTGAYAGYAYAHIILSYDTIPDSYDWILTNSYDYNPQPNDSQLINFNIPIRVNQGNYYLLYVADYSKNISETNEDNNIIYFPIYVNDKKCDYYPSSVTFPDTVSEGEYGLSYSLTIKNLGNGTAPSDNVQIYLSKDMQMDNSDLYLNNYSISSISVGDSIVSSYTIPNRNIKAGDYYLIFIIDVDESILESDETNNTIISNQFTISPSKVDLELSYLQLSSSTGNAGSSISYQAKVKNTGTKRSESVYTGIYISTDTILNDYDQTFAYYTNGNINAGDSSSMNSNFTIPSTLDSGMYYILFVADYYKYIIESNENNNVQWKPLLVDNSTQYDVDLKFSSISISDSTVNPGQYITIPFQTQNIGSTSSNYTYAYVYMSLDTIFSLSDVYLSNSYISSLNTGGTYNNGAYFYLPSTGLMDTVYYLLTVIDPYNYNYETNRSNNIAVQRIVFNTNPGGTVDFEPTTVTIADTITGGASTTMNFYIKNNGNTIDNLVNYYIYLSKDQVYDPMDYAFSSSSVNNLNPGDSVYVSFNPTLNGINADGDWYIIIRVDPSNNKLETNEFNNQYIEKFYGKKPAYDWNISGSLSSPVASSGAYITAYPIIENPGSTSSPNQNLFYYLSMDSVFDANFDYNVTSYSISTLTPGQISYPSHGFTLPALDTGLYYIFMVMDPTNTSVELDETNNSKRFSLEIQLPTTDLVIVNDSLSDYIVEGGSSITIYADVKNIGNSTISSSSNLYYFYSTDAIFNDGIDVQIGSDNVGSLGAGSFSWENISYTIPASAGTYYIILVADYNNFITESNESNNIQAIPITVVPKNVDLVPTSCYVSDDTPTAGQSITIYNYVKNTGSAQSVTSYVGYYLSTDSLWDALDYYYSNDYVGALNQNDSVSNNYSFNFPSVAEGKYFILVKADYQLANAELNEDNNVVAIPVYLDVIDVDYVSNHNTVTVDSAYQGTNVSISCYVKNIGSEKYTTNACYVYYYLSADTLYQSTDIYLSSSYAGYINGNDSLLLNATVNMGSNAPGMYYLLWVSDRNSNIPELNENNNTSYKPIKIMPTQADLIVDSIYFAKDTADMGGICDMTYWIKNTGGTSVNSYNVGIYLSNDTLFDPYDLSLQTRGFSTLNAGATSNYSEAIPMKYVSNPGQYYILIIVDYNYAVVETNELNNNRWKLVTIVPPKSDIKSLITSYSLSEDTVNVSTNFTLNYTLENIGTATSAPFNVGFALSQDTVYDYNMDYLYTNVSFSSMTVSGPQPYSRTININSSVPEGAYYMLVVADYNSQLTDMNEINNTGYSELYVKNASSVNIDIVVTDTVFNADTVKPSQVVPISFINRNIGTSNSAYVYTGIYISTDPYFDALDKSVTSYYISSLSAGGSSNTNTNITIPGMASGHYYLLIVADMYNYRIETNEKNNLISIPIYIDNSSIDLIAKNAQVSKPQIYSGTIFSASCYVKNIGLDNTGYTYTRLLLSSNNTYETSDLVVSSNYYTNALNSGDSILNNFNNVTMPGAVAGNYYLIFVADIYGYAYETNELNNYVAIPVTIKNMDIDLIADSLNVNLTDIWVNDTLDYFIRVKNNGSTLINYSYNYYYLSTDMVIDPLDVYIGNDYVNGLDSAQYEDDGYSYILPASIPGGTYYLITKIDNNNSISEINEVNNYIYTSLYIHGLPVPKAPTAIADSICMPGMVKLVASGAGPGEIYKWYNASGSYIPGQDSAEYSYYAAIDQKFYVAIDSLGFESAKVPVQVIVYSMPSDSFQVIGGNYLNAIDKDPAYTYQWVLNGTDIPGATTDAYDATATGEGNYSFIITNGLCMDTSVTKTVKALKPASPLAFNDSLCGSGTANLIASGATGVEVYIWYDSNGVIIPGEDSSLYSVALSSSADFYVAIDSAGFYSDKVPLSAVMYVVPQNTFTVNGKWLEADFTGPFAQYKWLKNGSVISGATSEKYNTFTTGDGNYSMIIQNGVCLDTSSTVNVVVPLTDMTITQVTQSADTIVNGLTSYSVTHYVKNVGNTATPSTYVGYYLSTDNKYDTFDLLLESYSITGIAANDSILVSGNSISLSTQNGTFYLIVKADNSNVVDEDYENNNTIAKRLYFRDRQVDLISSSSPASTKLSKTTALANSSVTTYTYIINRGKDQSATSYVGYYFSTDTIVDVLDYQFGTDYVGTLNQNDSSYESASFTVPAVPEGTYYVLVKADYAFAVSETSENNNVRILPIFVKVLDIDIITITHSLSADTIIEGNSLSGYCYIKNNGTDTISGNAYVNYYLSNDTLFDITDYSITTDYASNLTPGNTSSENFSFTIPSMAEGLYYILFYSDKNNSFSESNEYNNISYLPFYIQATDADLYFIADSLVNDTVEISNYATLNYTLRNAGTSPTSNCYVNYYLSKDMNYDATDKYISDRTIGSINGGSTSSYSQQLLIPSMDSVGNYYILAYINFNMSMPEANITNNVAAIPIVLKPSTSSLTTIADSLNLSTVTAGSSVRIWGRIINNGSNNAASTITAIVLSNDSVYSYNDYILTNYSTGTVNAGNTFSISNYNLNIPSGIVGGTYYIIIRADYAESLSDIDPSDNSDFLAINVTSSTTSLPDLHVTDTTISKDTVFAGSTVNVTAIVRNKGTATASSSYLGLYLSKDDVYEYSDIFISSYYQGTMSAGGSESENATITIPASTPAGLYYLMFIADYYKYRYELNEDNNICMIPIYVKPFANKVDLVPVSASLNKQVYKQGESMNIQFYVKNIGDSTVTNNISVYVYVSQDSLYQTSDYNWYNPSISTTLNKNDSALFNNTYTLSSFGIGKRYLLFYTDRNNTIAEFNENNNILSIPFEIKESTVDLTVLSPSFNKTSFYVGDNVTATCTVKNQGTSQATAQYIRMYLSADNKFDNFDYYFGQQYTGTLDSMASEVENFNYSIPTVNPGNYYILLFTDYSNTVIESNENNNVYAQAVTILASPVPQAPIITAERRCNAGKLTLKASGAGAGETYKWYDSDGTTYLSGEDSANYTTAFLLVSKKFYVQIDSAGFRSEKVMVMAYIDTMPSSSSFTHVGNTLTASFYTVNSTYQWMLNGSNISGSIARSHDVALTGVGNYMVKINEGACMVQSSPYTVNGVIPKPAEPSVADVERCGTGNVTFTASGAKGVSAYKWFTSNAVSSAISGQTSATLTRNVTKTDTFWVAVDTLTVLSNLVDAVVTVKFQPDASFSQIGSVLQLTNDSTGSTYQWLFNNSAISGATTTAYTATQSGEYTLIVSFGTCSDTVTQTVNLSEIELVEVAELDIIVYPNPTDGLISLEMNNLVQDEVSIEILSINAAKLIDQQLMPLNGKLLANINLTSMPAGIYILKVEQNGKLFIKQINKNK